ncbi:F-box protein SKIP22-like isoform X1 [Lycium ferocissimum]|uniref:F-box protein SKIP22-like isoform X1 n=1 Tax=Lycium ferocissimum TaxID=112874 RepID=UPI002814DEE4|nr:F-box protein SKIP22-like isoform X1 [Lycium ferocissimum]
MKLRIRCFETKQTLKINIPSSSCTLQELKHVISQAFPSSSSSNSIHLSLNRKEELQNSEETLQSIGITSGDLIFFTYNPNVFSISTQTHIPKSNPNQDSNLLNKLDTQIVQECKTVENMDTQIVQESETVKKMDTQLKNTDTQVVQEPEKVKNLDTQVVQEPEKVKILDTQVVQEPEKVKNVDTHVVQEPEKVKILDTQMVQEPEKVRNMDTHEAKTLNSIHQGDETDDFMEVDGDYSGVNLTKSFSVPGFLRKVFTEELSDDGGRDHKLLVVALHAVFVESGFVLLDPVSFTELSGTQFLKNWPSGASRMRLFYTLPEVIDHVKRGNSDVIHTIELKFQSLGMFFIAHGSLSGGVSARRVTLNEDQLVPFLNVVWANCGLNEEVNGVSITSPEKEVFMFWRNVKDGLVLPLLIDLCEKSGLALPPCFTRLPTDLKLKILESLPGVEIAKVSCLSSELRYLGSSDDLWKKKYAEHFGDGEISGEGGHWKEKFVKSWESRKRRKVSSRRRFVDPLSFLGGPHRFPGPWRPHIIGGDYDLFAPQFDNTGNPFGRAPPSRLLHPLSNHVPRCNLGGHRSNFT